EVRDRAVRELEPVEETGETALTVLEVTVAASKAADLAERLRAEGCGVRVAREAAR
ncbi:MAG: hypothetical protein IRZ07_18810, partial [Microbispora sp.]|nr:hypothetical protein [Microbispora sp.]